jgi:hypothetical protein
MISSLQNSFGRISTGSPSSDPARKSTQYTRTAAMSQSDYAIKELGDSHTMLPCGHECIYDVNRRLERPFNVRHQREVPPMTAQKYKLWSDPLGQLVEQDKVTKEAKTVGNGYGWSPKFCAAMHDRL